MVGRGRSAGVDAGDVSAHGEARILRRVLSNSGFRGKVPGGEGRKLVGHVSSRWLTPSRSAQRTLARRLSQWPIDDPVRETAERTGEEKRQGITIPGRGTG